jgi:hypothetical protein
VSLLRYALVELRTRWSRTIPTLLASILAVSSFVVLTGTVERQRLEVTQLVEANARGAYDILVRPKGSTSEIEASQQIVREDYLSGVYGGITLDQVKEIRDVPGVEVAAPIAMLGVTWLRRRVPLDVHDALKGRDRALLKFVVNDQARNGTVKGQSWTGYIYLTREKLRNTGTAMGGKIQKVAGGSVKVCLDVDLRADQPGSSVNDPAARWWARCQSAQDDVDELNVFLSYPLFMAGVDPQAENQLLGLSSAGTTGRPLETVTKKDYRHDESATYVPAVISSRLNADYQTSVRVETLSDSLIDPLFAAGSNDERRKLVMAAPGTPVGNTVTTDATKDYTTAAAKLTSPSTTNSSGVFVSALWQTGQIRYTDSEGVLHPVEAPTTSKTWRNDACSRVPLASLSAHTGADSCLGATDVLIQECHRSPDASRWRSPKRVPGVTCIRTDVRI